MPVVNAIRESFINAFDRADELIAALNGDSPASVDQDGINRIALGLGQLAIAVRNLGRRVEEVATHALVLDPAETVAASQQVDQSAGTDGVASLCRIIQIGTGGILIEIPKSCAPPLPPGLEVNFIHEHTQRYARGWHVFVSGISYHLQGPFETEGEAEESAWAYYEKHMKIPHDWVDAFSAAMARAEKYHRQIFGDGAQEAGLTVVRTLQEDGRESSLDESGELHVRLNINSVESDIWLSREFIQALLAEFDQPEITT